MAQKALLAIDGGGIRGIIPLCALLELEKQTGKPAREVFSFISGTSTGAIITGGLAIGMPVTQLLDMYQQLGPHVFRKDYLGWITSLGSFKYRSKPLADLMRQYLGTHTLNELTVDVMITAKRVQDGKPWYFVRDTAANAGTTGKLDVVDCVTASAAAPTYFEPWDVPGIGPCVDGGVGVAGNPAYQACVEAFYYMPAGAYPVADTLVVSLGTGYYDSLSNPRSLVGWANWVLGELLMSPAEQQTELVARHFVTAGTYRINPPMPRDIGMDAVNAIPELIDIGKQAAAGLDWKAILAGKPHAKRVPPGRGINRNLP